jgi:predicted DNA-binding transcriptional regulator YafY
MANTKHAQIRYYTLDKCFSNFGREYNYEDLLVECNLAIEEFSGQKQSIQLRQLQNDIMFMESDENWSIVLEKYRKDRKIYFRYKDPKFSIINTPVTILEKRQLKEAIFVLNRIKSLPKFEWVNEMMTKIESVFGEATSGKPCISYDSTPYLKGGKYILDLYHKINNESVLEIKYKSFNEPLVTYILHPHYLKQYNNRWFLFGINDVDSEFKNLPLDRIHSYKVKNIDFIESEINFEEYFEDVIGVTVFPEESELVKMKIDASLWPYVETKPFHGSQKVFEKNKDYTTIILDLKMNYELESRILQHGEKVEIIEPKHLRAKIQSRVFKMMKNYS